MGDAIVILGPTCSGKSAVGARLAHRLSGEVISFDSMQVYRDLPIGTAQPTAEELSLAPHHLVGFLPLEAPWNVNLFLPKAQELLDGLSARKRAAVFVGGTGLYARALVYGFSLMPGDPELSERLRQEGETPEGLQALREELKSAGDPPVDLLQNPRHLLRAVEVLRLTGTPPWLLKKRHEWPREGFRQFCLLPDFSRLKERIRVRTAGMLSGGWVEECERALSLGLESAPTAWQALGYRDLAAWLKAGCPGGRAALQETLANRTIQYARRQLTWFRHQHPGAEFLEIKEFCGDTADALVEEILRRLQTPPPNRPATEENAQA